MKTKLGLMLAMLTVVTAIQVFAIEETYVIKSDWTAMTQDKWFTDYYNREGVNNDTLRVGGWGDHYISMIKIPLHFNVPGDRIVLHGATLNLYSYGSERPTSMQKWFFINPWSETSTTDHWTLSYYDFGQVPAPSVNGWYSLDISSEFYYWLVGTYPNYGIGLYPNNVNNKFNWFYSSEGYNSSLRPYIEVKYERMPYFKMPLPGGKYWKCTTIPGGGATHQGANFYALDFSYKHYDENNNLIENKTDIPILASADGTVIETGYDPIYNGNYVKLDHDLDNSWSTGLQTVYLHMKNNSVVVHQGQFVRQGELLGIMGSTGDSTGIHLHFQFYYKHQGSSQQTAGNNSMLNLINLEDTFPINGFLEGYFYQSTSSHWSF